MTAAWAPRQEHRRPERCVHGLVDRVGPFVVAGAALATCTALALRDPREEGAYGMCPWLLLTGTHCPGCGSLRSISRLLAGDFVGAASYNIFTVVTVPFLLIAYLRWAFPSSAGARLPNVNAIPARWILTFAGALMCFWFLRNTPLTPFSGLAP